jgi:hypothetical protein
MRLLKTGPYAPGNEKLELIQRWGNDVPAYAILSHTWSQNPDDEVLFADVQNGTSASKPAVSKLWHAIERARLDGYGYIWIDTCCIDKTSSVELSEAINSMYAYYRDAQKAYGYMPDVSALGDNFHTSRWFSRSWTLQELIAPRILEFFTSDWISLGFKADLHTAITSVTGIENEYLSLTLPVEHASIAKRMSWASSRQATREEDMAYCLLGMFDVNMPMLYGEGSKRAFARLQEEIMRSNEDQSIFAWLQEPDDETIPSDYHGLLADSPKNFRRTGSTKTYTEVGDYNPCNMTARGLKLTLPLTPKHAVDGLGDILIAALQCPVASRDHSGWLAVYLQKMPSGSNQYARVDCKNLASVSELGMPQELYVRQRFPSFTVPIMYPYHFFQVRRLACYSDTPGLIGYKIVDAFAMVGRVAARFPSARPQTWSNVHLVYQIIKSAGALSVALVLRRAADNESVVLMLGADSDFTVGFDVIGADSVRRHDTGLLQKCFAPRPAGQFMELEHHKIRVTVEEHVRANQKIYFLDIEIRAIPTAPTAGELLDDAFDALVSSGPEKHAANVALHEKVKRFTWRKKSEDGRH